LMKECVLDGARLADPDAVYRELAKAFQFPEYFGNNPDALWDALGDYSGEPIAVVWRNAARSADLLGPECPRIVTVLRQAAVEGMLALELA
jgi:RNAse (barnase) inhibitor barstar